jgi:hypothetical protein
LLLSAKQLPAAQEDPLLQALHAMPPAPHALFVVPGLHVPPEQHPEQEMVSQVHMPLVQRRPLPQVPLAQMSPHPSLAPHALPPQVGVHEPVPHRFGPPPPHVCPEGHPPQLRT